MKKSDASQHLFSKLAQLKNAQRPFFGVRERFSYHISKGLNSVGYSFHRKQQLVCCIFKSWIWHLLLVKCDYLIRKQEKNYLLSVIGRAAGWMVSGKVTSSFRAVVAWHCDIWGRGPSSAQTTVPILVSKYSVSSDLSFIVAYYN